MKKQQLLQRISDRIEQDQDFAAQLGEAIDKGTWEIVFELIAKVVGYAINKTGKSLDFLKDLRL